MMPRVIVSDHALLRYFERVLEVDMDQVRAKLAAEIAAAAAAGATKYTKGGTVFVMDRTPSGDICIVTVLTEKMRRHNNRLLDHRRRKAVAGKPDP